MVNGVGSKSWAIFRYWYCCLLLSSLVLFFSYAWGDEKKTESPWSSFKLGIYHRLGRRDEGFSPTLEVNTRRSEGLPTQSRKCVFRRTDIWVGDVQG